VEGEIMVDNFRIIDSKKYMWDGSTYETQNEASEKKSQYEGEGFEAQLLEELGQFLVYTRRVVTDVVVEGSP